MEYTEFRQLFEVRIQSLRRAVDFLDKRIRTARDNEQKKELDDQSPRQEQDEDDVSSMKKQKRPRVK
jgi:hypothetical protein